MAFPGLLRENRWSSAAYHTWNIGPITTVPTAVIRAVLMTSCSRRGTFSTHCCAMKSPTPRRAPDRKKNVKVVTLLCIIQRLIVRALFIMCLESGESAPSILSQVGAGWVLATAAIDYYQKFITVFYGTRSTASFTNKSGCYMDLWRRMFFFFSEMPLKITSHGIGQI